MLATISGKEFGNFNRIAKHKIHLDANVIEVVTDCTDSNLLEFAAMAERYLINWAY